MHVDRIPAGEPDVIASDLLAELKRDSGREPVGCFRAPGRVNLIGEHVDYNQGKCLPMALPHATYCALAPRADDTVWVRSRQQDEPWQGRLSDLGPGKVSGWPAYVAGVVWALQEIGVRLPGIDVVVDSRVPVGAGLSSSAALECSVALGLCALADVQVDAQMRRRLVEVCVRAEQEVAGAPTGGMDQSVVMLARTEHALLLDCRDWSTSQVPWDPAAHGLRLLVVDTRATHELTDGGYGARRRDCELGAETLDVPSLREVPDVEAALARLSDERIRRRVRHVLTEMRRVDAAADQLRAGDYRGLGQTFSASHTSMRDDFEISCEELDAVVEAALAHGAWGARMTGGGFGGSAIALVPEESVSDVEQAIVTAFHARGWPAPGVLAADPADGACRLR